MFIVDSLTNPVPINGRRLFPGGSTDRHLSFLIRVPTSESVEPQFSPDYRPAIFLGLTDFQSEQLDMTGVGIEPATACMWYV